jgi:hypothetical protein
MEQGIGKREILRGKEGDLEREREREREFLRFCERF